MASFEINVDISDLLNLVPGLKQEVLPRLHDAVGFIAQQAYEQWAADVQNARLWGKEKEEYIRSLKWDYTGDFSAEVRATYKLAASIEEGRAERDLKKMLDTSLKVRLSKKGTRYLIIPFRHNTPGSNATGRAMPFEVYQNARNLAASKILGHGKRLSGTGAYNMNTRQPITVRSRRYQWGEVLGDDHGRHYKGMYRFEAGSGGEKRSSFMTFRVMTEESKGWIVPAKPGLYIAKQVAERLRPAAQEVISEAIRRDLGI